MEVTETYCIWLSHDKSSLASMLELFHSKWLKQGSLAELIVTFLSVP